MKLLTATRHGSDFRILIHADETRFVVDPEHPEIVELLPDGYGRVAIIPDPSTVRGFTYGLDTADGAVSIEEQMQSGVTEAARVVQDEIDRGKTHEDVTGKLALPQL